MIRRVGFFLLWSSMCLGTAALRAEMFTFEIQPGVSPDPSSVAVEIEAPLVGTDDDISSISGSAVIDLEPAAGSFTHARIVELNLVLDDGFDFRLGFAGLLTASAAPGDVTATIVQPGPQVAIRDGVFDQPDNLFEMAGLIEVSVLDDPFDLQDLDPFSVDIEGVEITEAGNDILAEFALEIVAETEIEDIPIVGSVPLTITLDAKLLGVAARRVLPGDVDGNGVVDANDIDAISGAILAGVNSAVFDVNLDGTVNPADRDFWVRDLKGTYFGDANLDGEFNSADFISVFAAGEYEDGVLMNSTWISGDWNGDREFDSGDLIKAFQDGGFEQGPRTSAVPEPSSMFGFSLLMLIVFFRRTSRQSSANQLHHANVD